MTPALILITQFVSVDQISIVDDGERMTTEQEVERLNIFRLGTAGRRIPDMAKSGFPREVLQNTAREYLGYQTVSFVFVNCSVVIGGYSTAFLPAVLKCIQRPVQ